MAYSDEQINSKVDEICNSIESGESLRKVLAKDGMPSSKTFYEWIEGYEAKRKQYTHACEARADKLFDEILDIADTTKDGETIKTLPDGGKERTKGDMIQHRRLQIDARKWMLGKMNPKKYSDKVQVDDTPFVEQPLFPDLDNAE